MPVLKQPKLVKVEN